MTQNENIHFETFKKDFYSRVDDFSVFDFGKYNALKIVLDGLKVNYVERYKSKALIFYPIWILRIIFFLKYRKHAKEVKYINNHTPQKTTLLVDYSGRYGTLENGHEVPFYFNKIRQEIGSEFLHHITLHKKSGAIEYDWVYSSAFFLQYSRLSKKNKALRRTLLKLYKNIRQSNVFNKNELRNIQIALSSFFEQVNCWDTLLDTLPYVKMAIIEMHYHNEALIYCLRQRKIEVIEIQHGLISEKDIFYVFPEKIRPVKPRALFPDKIFVLGQYWKNVLLKGADYADNPDNIIVLGNYQITTTTMPDAQKQEITDFVKQSEVILVTTQTLMHDDFNRYIQWLSDDLIQKKQNYKIIVKIHPNEKMEDYSPLKKLKNVLVTKLNLYYLFSISKIHISIYSTALYDALQFNVQNFSLHCDYAEDYRGEILKDGIALPLEHYENPVDVLTRATFVKEDSVYYFDDFNRNKGKLFELISHAKL